MDRTAWTDERLDDAMEAIRYGFARTDEDIRALRNETRTEIHHLRTELREGFTDVRAEMAALRLVLLRLGGGLMIGLAGIIVTLLVQGPA